WGLTQDAKTLRLADAGGPADRHLAALLALRLECRACRCARTVAAVRLVPARRLRDALGGVRLQRHRRPGVGPASRAKPAATARLGQGLAQVGLDTGDRPVADRPDRSAATSPRRTGC